MALLAEFLKAWLPASGAAIQLTARLVAEHAEAAPLISLERWPPGRLTRCQW
ncbi:hypothetical protein PJI17_02795 [Mycobacterium kansasii]|uniref:Uncharacterized protein n=1 Tax=Mycobacterium kansasii TaxID=1768 RepID=A0A1V3XXQ8_MYCKA|nr:hypothetical protein BZL29_0915 [Mycobacterium kansasii]